MHILRFEVKQHVSALYGHHQVFLSLKVALYKLREKVCDVEICHQIIILVCLCVGGYYATLIYGVSHELRSLLRESVPYVKLYRYNPKHLYPKLNGYGDNGKRKVWTS